MHLMATYDCITVGLLHSWQALLHMHVWKCDFSSLEILDDMHECCHVYFTSEQFYSHPNFSVNKTMSPVKACQLVPNIKILHPLLSC